MTEKKEVRKLPEEKERNEKERELYAQGEELAKIAPKKFHGQLDLLYRLAKPKPSGFGKSMPFIEAWVKRQITRVRGYLPIFGPRVLELLKKYEEENANFQKILMYADMLYDYYQKERGIGPRPPSRRAPPVSRSLQKAVETAVKNIVTRYGYKGLIVSEKWGTIEFRIKLSRFRGNPKVLADQVSERIRHMVPEASGLKFRVWIEQL